jgi:transposase
MSKFTLEEINEAVERYLNGNESAKDIAKSIGINQTTLNEWIRHYEHNGLSVYVKPYTSYTLEFKLNVLKYMTENGTSSYETAAIFNIPSPSNIRTWKRKLEVHGIDALQSKKKGRLSMKKDSTKQIKQKLAEGSVEALEARIKQLEMENEYLKKLNALVQNKEKSPNKTKRK